MPHSSFFFPTLPSSPPPPQLTAKAFLQLGLDKSLLVVNPLYDSLGGERTLTESEGVRVDSKGQSYLPLDLGLGRTCRIYQYFSSLDKPSSVERKSDLALSEEMEKYKAGPPPFMIAALYKCQGKRKLHGKAWVHFCCFAEEEDFLAFNQLIPPGGRFIQEILVAQHRPVWDIERDYPPEAGMEDLQKDRLACRRWLLPLLVEYFQGELGLEVTLSDLKLLDSSLPGRKFSQHVVLSAGYFFQNRADEWVCMIDLIRFLEGKRATHPEFENWYVLPSGRMVDWSVYGVGKRNMRGIGACKGPGQKLGTPWQEARVLTPRIEDEETPYWEFLATPPINFKEVIPIGEGLLERAQEFALAETEKKQPWFQNHHKFTKRKNPLRKKRPRPASPPPPPTIPLPDLIPLLPPPSHQSLAFAQVFGCPLDTSPRRVEREITWWLAWISGYATNPPADREARGAEHLLPTEGERALPSICQARLNFPIARNWLADTWPSILQALSCPSTLPPPNPWLPEQIQTLWQVWMGQLFNIKYESNQEGQQVEGGSLRRAIKEAKKICQEGGGFWKMQASKIWGGVNLKF